MSQPELIGRFVVVSVLGRGAMGVVYRAHDPVIDRPVAIKLVRSDLLEGDDRESYIARFRNEARIAGRFAHPNIVGVYDFAMHEGNPYLVMEHVEGVPLHRAYKRGTKAPFAEVLRIGLQTLDALDYAHAFGVVHRDVKPANILLTQGSRLKVADFGISRLISNELTVDALMIGTPSYMSPEQARGDPVDQRSDLFSLGSVLYELLAGTQPFSGRDYNATLHQLMNEPHAPLVGLRADVPPALASLIDRTLQKRPEDRFESAASFSAAMRGVDISAERVDRLVQPLKEGLRSGAGPDETAKGGVESASLATQQATSGVTADRDRDPLATERPSLDPGRMATIERRLARYVGRVARRYVRHAAEQHSDVDGLARSLGDRIPDSTEREKFVTSVRALFSPPAGRSQPAAQPASVVDDPASRPTPIAAAMPVPLAPAATSGAHAAIDDAAADAAELGRVTRALAHVLGPVAATLVRRARARSASTEGIIAACEEWMADERERVLFRTRLAAERAMANAPPTDRQQEGADGCD